MQTYLKTKPVWIQLLLFIGMAAGIAMVIFFIGTILLTVTSGMSLMEISDPSSWDPTDKRVLNMLRGLMLIQFLGVFLIPALLFAYFSDPQPGRYLGLKKPSSAIYWLIGIAILIVAIPLVDLSGQLNRKFPFNPSTLRWITEMEEEASKTLKLLLGSTRVEDLLINLVFIAGFAAIGEELVFRGIIQRLLIRAFKSPWPGIILAAFLFSFFHMQFFGFIPRFLLGILLGALYWYSGSLWTAMLAHFVYDGLILTLAFFSPELVNDPNASVINSSSIIVMSLASAALVVMLFWMMKRNSSTEYAAVYANDKPAENNDISF
jgi:uncharacterized protein